MKNIELQGLNADKVWDYENGFYWFSSKNRLAKIIVQYEIYKHIVDLPGCFMEFGVHKSLSLLRFALYRDILEKDSSRKIIGFDVFDIFPSDSLSMSSDINFSKSFNVDTGFPLKVDEIKSVLSNKNFTNIDLIEGNIFATLDRYILDNPNLEIACIHFDLDVYEPTEFVLDRLYKNVVSGGLLIFDDYGVIEGETRAVDEFLRIHGLELHRHHFLNSPSYIIKP